MSGDMIDAVLVTAIVGATVLVRLGWAGRRGVSVTGWIVAAIAAIVLVARDGAWGLAIGTVAGIAAALVLVLYAGWTSPAKDRRAARVSPSITLPRRPGDLARRLAVFVLVVPTAFAAAQWLAFGVQAAARRGGAGDADAIVLTLFLQPVSWGAIMAWQMTRSGPARMIVPPVAAALLGTMLWGAA